MSIKSSQSQRQHIQVFKGYRGKLRRGCDRQKERTEAEEGEAKTPRMICFK